MANNKTFLAFSCVHLPHHDVAGVNWLISQIAERQPDVVVCLGDMFDAESISRFAKSNVVALKNEYDAVNEFCERVNDASPKSRRVWMRGNHEDRMFREEHKHLTGILDYRQWIKAAKSWQHFDYIYSPDHTYTLGPVTFAHGWVTGEAACKREAIELGVANGLYVHGHTHRPHRPHRIKLGKVRVPFHHANAGCFIAQKPGYMKTQNDSEWGAGVVVGHTPTKRRYEGSCKWRADTLLYKMHWDEIEPTWQGVAA